MTVEKFEPTEDILNITPSAADHFKLQLKKKNKSAIRVSLRESGCTGYKYVVEEIDVPTADDIPMMLSNSVQVFIDPNYVPSLQGTTIDYVKQGLNHQLVLRNPNVADACGCGESFNFN